MSAGWHYRHRHLALAAPVAVLAGLVTYAGLLFNTLALAMLAGAAGAVLRRAYWLVRGRLAWPFTETWRRSPLVWQALNRTLFWTLAAVSFFPAVVREPLGAGYVAAITVYGAACGLLVLLAWTAAPRVSVVRNALTAAASIALGVFLWTYHSPPADPVSLASPFAAGEWRVVHGGRSPIANHHYGLRAQRHAIDFLRADAGAALGTELIAPAGGRVARAVDAFPDQPAGGSDRSNPAGNHVSIEIAPGRFVILAHLQRGSVAVRVDQVVARGAPVGRVGSSGNTSEPHLHVQVQNAPEMSLDRRVRTYPMVFDAEVRYRGRPDWTAEAKADLRRGDRVRGR